MSSEDKSQWNKKLVVKILLLVARMFADDPWAEEIKALANHISV